MTLKIDHITGEQECGDGAGFQNQGLFTQTGSKALVQHVKKAVLKACKNSEGYQKLWKMWKKEPYAPVNNNEGYCCT